MRRLTLILLISFLAFSLTGCKSIIRGRSEINKLIFVTVFGIDKSTDKEDSIKITLAAPSVKSSQKGGQKDKADPYILTSQGSSVFEAIRRIRLYKDRMLFYGHNAFILIGEDASKKDLQNLLDFLSRDHELRLNSKVLIVKGSTAEELIKSTKENKEYLGDALKNLLEHAGGISQSGTVELIELMRSIDDKHASSIIPYISLKENAVNSDIGSDEKDIYHEGYAIFKNTDLYGFVNLDVARGLNLITNRTNSGIYIVKTKKGEKVSLELIEAKSKIIPKIKNNKIFIKIKLHISSNIGEQQGTEKIYDEKSIHYLEGEQAQLIKSITQSTINYAKESNTDFLKIGSAIEHKYPVKWETIKQNWEKTFGEITYDIEVDSRISRTYNIEEPNRSLED